MIVNLGTWEFIAITAAVVLVVALITKTPFKGEAEGGDKKVRFESNVQPAPQNAEYPKALSADKAVDPSI